MDASRVGLRDNYRTATSAMRICSSDPKADRRRGLRRAPIRCCSPGFLQKEIRGVGPNMRRCHFHEDLEIQLLVAIEVGSNKEARSLRGTITHEGSDYLADLTI